MKNKTIKKIIYIFSIILVGVICLYIGKKSSNAKESRIDISNMFFVQDSRDYIKNMTIYNEESVTVNGMIYTLESSVYVKKCNIGYYVISVKQENGKTDIINSGIQINSMGGRMEKCEIQGNTLFYYFAKSEMNEEDILQIMCSHADTKGDCGIIRFNLINNESVDVKSFSNDKYVCEFSPIGYSILHSEEEINEVVINYDNGDEKTLYYYPPLQDIRDGKEKFEDVVISDTTVGWDYFNDMSWDTPEKMDRFTLFFNKWYNIEKISAVTVNGEKLEIEN